jgi:thiol protease/hemagglutinin prtT
VFDPKETQTLGLMALAELRGSKGYSGALRYRAMDIDDGTFTELGSKSYVSFQPFAYITPKSTLVEFPLNRLKSGHTYEVHVEIDKDGQWTDVWNNVTPRVQFAVESSLSTDISSVKTTSKSPEVYNLQGVRITTPTDQLPKGIYIINGKKVKK